jgi:hypothetical protein
LRAALKLARLYQSIGHAAEAHEVLEPALSGFAPTPEMPEIAEGLALLGRIASAESAWERSVDQHASRPPRARGCNVQNRHNAATHPQWRINLLLGHPESEAD